VAFLATLRQSGGISALSRQLGEPLAQTMAAADALIPDLLSDFQNYSGGLDGLLELVGEVGGGAMAQAIMEHEPVDTRPGILILSKIKRLGVVSDAERNTPDIVDPELRQRMMPLLAMLMGGYLSARATSGGLNMQELAALIEARKTFYSPGEEQV
jgi:hypothetical protein